MQYREFAPAPDLRPLVRCYWSLAGVGSGIERVLPDGRAELAVHLGDPFQIAGPGDTPERQPSSLFIGQMRRVSTLRPGRRVRVFGVRFHPLGAGALVGPAQRELAGRIVALADAWGAEARRWEARLNEAPCDAQRAAITDEFLRSRRRRGEVAARIRHAADLMAGQPSIRITDAAAAAGASVRQFQRQFLDSVGLTPKEWTRVVRLQHALALRRAHSDWNWARISQEAGYYDQAHLAADCREIAGAPPSARETEETAMERFLASWL